MKEELNLQNAMKILTIIVSAIFCLFLFRFLNLYIDKDTSLYISIATYIGILAGLLIKLKEDTHEYIPYKPMRIHESDTFDDQEARIEKTRIASQKRKARKLTK